jgi:hypothetical protein
MNWQPKSLASLLANKDQKGRGGVMRKFMSLCLILSLLAGVSGCAGGSAQQREVWQQQRSQQGQDELSRETQHSTP